MNGFYKLLDNVLTSNSNSFFNAVVENSSMHIFLQQNKKTCSDFSMNCDGYIILNVFIIS